MIEAPLCLYRTRVPAEWVDYNGHMSEARYLEAVGANADAFFRLIGIDDAYRAAGRSLYTVETHLRHLGEAAKGDRLRCTLQLLDHDSKRVHLFHGIFGEADRKLLATAEQMLLHVDMRAAKSAPIPLPVLGKLADIARAHDPLGRPDGAGRAIGIPKRADA